MKLTEKFPGDVKPVRVGFYAVWWCKKENTYPLTYPHYCYWDGKEWWSGCKILNVAVHTHEHQRPLSHYYNVHANHPHSWCGVTESSYHGS